MIISLIAARSKNNVIGKDNDLPWRLPADMKYFMNTTKGHVVIMGRKNWESLPNGALKNRTNIVITRSKQYQAEGALVMHHLEDALQYAFDQKEEEVFIIGGAQIYKIGLNIADRLYLTEIDLEVEGDTFFPSFDLANWKRTQQTDYMPDDRNAYAYSFQIFERLIPTIQVNS